MLLSRGGRLLFGAYVEAFGLGEGVGLFGGGGVEVMGEDVFGIIHKIIKI